MHKCNTQAIHLTIGLLPTAVLVVAALCVTTALPARADGKDVLMEPKVKEAGAGTFRPESIPLLLVGESLRKANSPAILPIQQRLQTQFPGVEQAVPSKRALPRQPFIMAGLPSDHPALDKLASDMKQSLPKEGLGEEGYLLQVSPSGVLITADRLAGVYYGARKLVELVGDPGSPLSIPAVKIADWPALRWRGMHVMVGGRSSLPALERLITQLLPERRLNRLILEINYHFRYRSHPEIAEGDALTVEDCRRLRDLADQHFVRLIPMINCLGHQSWAKNTAQFLKAHPEFDETPDLPPDNPGIYCRSWCPSHPDINKTVFDLFDELIDAFHADAFHVGMDEVFILGECPRCKGKPTADLFAKAVNDYHSHLTGRRRVRMMMWGDRLLDSEVLKYGKWEASANGTAPAIDRIPKDIVLCDWHYEGPSDYPSVKYLLEKGFPVWPAGWNREERAAQFAGVALQNAGGRMMGYLATTWTGVDAITAGLAGDAKALEADQNVKGVAAAVNRTSRLAWEGR